MSAPQAIPLGKVILLVNGMEYAGWKKVSISAGIERQARDFALEVTDTWPGQTTIPRRVRPGDLCELYVDKKKVLTGYIDATPIDYDHQRFTVEVKGRSKTADLVDCSAIHKPGQFRNAKVEDIATALAAPYGIKIRAGVDTGAVVPDHQVQQGESVFESIDRLLRLRNLLSTDNADGDLVLIKVGSLKAADALVFGQNILAGSAELDWKDRYSEYVCKGQRAGTDDSYGEPALVNDANIADATLRRKRVLVLQQSGQADEGTCAQRVNYEMTSRAGKSLATTYKVQGWFQSNGELWQPNMAVIVKDEIIGFDRSMIVSEVQYTLDENGTITTLKVAPAAAFQVKPKQKKTQVKSVAGDGWGDMLPPDSGDGSENDDEEGDA